MVDYAPPRFWCAAQTDGKQGIWYNVTGNEGFMGLVNTEGE